MTAISHVTVQGRSDTPEAPFLSLVICTLDEAESIGNVLSEVEAILAWIPHETLVVDDSADEATANAVRASAASLPSVRLVRRKGSRGLASAAIAGWDEARGNVLAIMDGDGQHDPRLLPEMLQRIASVDIVVASRYAEREPSGLSGWRHAGSRISTLATFATLGVYSTDPLSGLFMMRRGWYRIARDRLSGVGFKILVDILASGQGRPALAEIQTALRPRIGGNSKLDARIVVELIALLVEKRTGGLVPARFCLFAMIGATGLGVHLSALSALIVAADLSFWLAQALGTFCAMTSNFFLNNGLTFRDQRLSGAAMLQGLVTFCLCCSGGALVSQVVGSALNGFGINWAVAGLAGAVTAAVANFLAAKRATWGAQPFAGTASEIAGARPTRILFRTRR